MGCISDEQEYRKLVNHFVALCWNNPLNLKVNKTKERIVDFGRVRNEPKAISVLGEEVEMVEDYRCLAVPLESQLAWKFNTETVYKKEQSKLYFLRRLRSFNICTKMLYIYKSVVETSICLGSSIRASDSEVKQTDRESCLCKEKCCKSCST